MLELTRIRNQFDDIVSNMAKRGFDATDQLNAIIKEDDNRKSIQTTLDQLLAERNSSSKMIGQLMAQGKRDEAESAKARVSSIKSEIETLEQQQRDSRAALEVLLLDLPNEPDATVPAGSTEDDNEVFKTWEGELPTLADDALDHLDLARKFNLIDFELGAKITGAGFPVFRGKGARLVRGLVSYFLSKAGDAGYEEILPPHLINEDSARGTGQLPDKEGQMYHATADNLFLIPTAEVPITNIYRDVILKDGDFSVKMCGYTPCFRREAGSHGKEVRGLNRVHQFNKVEIVRIEHPDKSNAALMDMLAHVEGLLSDLELPYRILRLCGGDLGSAASLTFDFEVWSAAQKRWLEVSSVSNFKTYQANRLKLRFKDGKKSQLAHTLNGSALALARIIAALMEHNQTPEGIILPKALVPYVGFERLD